MTRQALLGKFCNSPALPQLLGVTASVPCVLDQLCDGDLNQSYTLRRCIPIRLAAAAGLMLLCAPSSAILAAIHSCSWLVGSLKAHSGELCPAIWVQPCTSNKHQFCCVFDGSLQSSFSSAWQQCNESFALYEHC